jgi:hypothetical protein
LGIVAATLIGVFMGIIRLSRNWLVAGAPPATSSFPQRAFAPADPVLLCGGVAAAAGAEAGNQFLDSWFLSTG